MKGYTFTIDLGDNSTLQTKSVVQMDYTAKQIAQRDGRAWVRIAQEAGGAYVVEYLADGRQIRHQKEMWERRSNGPVEC